MAQSQGSYARLDGGSSSGQTPFSGTPALQHQEPVRTVSATNRRDKHKLILYGLGIAECVIAGLMIILAIITLCLTARPYYSRYGYRTCYGCMSMTYSAQGLWGGVLVAVAGILGVCAKKNPSVCMYNANMAMSIVAASLLPAVVIMSGIASAMRFAVPLHIVITILSFAAMIICIIHSAYCCAGVCCGSKQYQGVVVYVPQQNQQLVRLANGQYAVPVGNTVMPQQYGYVMAASAQTPTAAVNFQPPQAGVFAQHTALPPQGAAAQPPTPNSPSTQDTSYPRGTENKADENPPSYCALP